MKIQSNIYFKNSIESIFSLSIVIANYIDIKNPWFAIVEFLAIISGLYIYALKKDTDTELKVNMIFLFLNPTIIGISCRILFNQKFDIVTIFQAVNTILIALMYKLSKDWFAEWYNRTGVSVIFYCIGILALMALLAILHVSIIWQIVIPIVALTILIKLTYK